MPDFGPDDFALAADVSCETLDRLKAYVALLTAWNARQNLVSRASLVDIWRRHVWDSAQLKPLIPAEAKTLADLGSGAGFPGLVLAVLLRGRLKVTLFEATAKKCAFLAVAAQCMQLDVTIRNIRMEDAPPQAFDVVTARACAPLPALLGYAQKFLGPNSVCLFLKGQNLVSELTHTHRYWSMESQIIPSKSDASGMILDVRKLVLHDTATQKASHPGRRQSKGGRG